MNTSVKKLTSLISFSLLSCTAIAQEIQPQAYHFDIDPKSERINIVKLKDAVSGTRSTPACEIPSFVSQDDLATRQNEYVYVARIYRESCRVISLRDAQDLPVPLSDYTILDDTTWMSPTSSRFAKEIIYLNHHDSLNAAYTLNSAFELVEIDSYEGKALKGYYPGELVENSTYKFIPYWPLSRDRLEPNLTVIKDGYSGKVVRKGRVKIESIVAGDLLLVENKHDQYRLVGYDRTVEFHDKEIFMPKVYLDNILYTNEEFPENSFTLSAFNSITQQTNVLGDFLLHSYGLPSIDVNNEGNLAFIRDTDIILNDKLDSIQLVLNAKNVGTVDYINLDIVGDVDDTGTLVTAEWDDNADELTGTYYSVNYIDTDTMAVNSLSFAGTQLEPFERMILENMYFDHDLDTLVEGKSIQYSGEHRNDDEERYNVDFSLSLVDGKFALSDVKVEKWQL